MAECGGCASARDRCGNGLEKIYPVTAVRYGKIGHIGEFAHEPDLAFTCGGKVIIQTDRGIEIGEQVSLTCFGCSKSVGRDAIKAYVKASGSDCYRFNNGRILREATEADLVEAKHLELEIKDKLESCRRLAEQNNLQMEIVDAEHIFGGERIIFYFMAEDRVDFRELVRQLAREFQTRIEMRQVGARDEARLLADYETCGRECCCKNFLKVLKPVGMQMAKLQKATLDPSKVSGRCGRLKCCLRYEHDTYSDLNKRLPRLGRRVRTETEEGVIIDRQILTQLLKIRKDDGTVAVISQEDITERDLPQPVAPVSEQEAGDRPSGRSDRQSGRADNNNQRNSNNDQRNDRRNMASPPSPKPAAQKPKPVDEAEPFGPQDWDEAEDGLADENVEGTADPIESDVHEIDEEEIAPEVIEPGKIVAPRPPQTGPRTPGAQPQQQRDDNKRRGRRRRRRDNRRRPRSPDSSGPSH